MELASLGWDEDFAGHFAPHAAKGLAPARVAVRHNDLYRVWAAAGEMIAEVAGRLRHECSGDGDLPAVGDWVAVQLRNHERALIRAVLPRRSQFVRKTAGRGTEQQVLASNLDTALLVAGLDNDFNLRRIERYLVMAWESGAAPVIVLNKADLCADPAMRVAEVEAVAPCVPVHAVSALRNEGLHAVMAYLAPGRTAALLGSSGVGKSAIINRLAGAELLRTQPVRQSDGRGRHTTTHRELILLPGGGMIIDTPGLRELQLWESDEGLHTAFDEISALAGDCRFSDCRHAGEPGCAVHAAVAAGRLAWERLQNYRKLQRELRFLERKQDKWARLEEKRRWKAIHRAASRHKPRE